MIFLRRNSNTLPHGFPSLSETFQLVRTLCQVSPDGDSLTPSGWPVTGPLAGPLRSVEGLPSRNIQLERKKNTAVCRYPQTHSFWRLAGILPFLHRNTWLGPISLVADLGCDYNVFKNGSVLGAALLNLRLEHDLSI